MLKKTWQFFERCTKKRRHYLELRERFIRRGYTPVYLDETGFESDAPRTHGYGKIGQRVYGKRLGNSRPRTSLLLAQCGKNLLAPMLFAGTCNYAVFNAWVKEVLLPELPPKSLVILDNAAFHKHPSTRHLVESHGHVLLFLAPYSPDHNPIEHTFSGIKSFRRKSQLSPYELMCNYLWE